MGDPYSRLDYRRMIAWPKRIQREWPLIAETLGSPAGRRVLDLGCGTGEHARFLAERGFEVVGVDVSASMLDKATEAQLPANLRFVAADLADLATAVTDRFDGAICLGNTLPHLRSSEALARFFAGLRRRLAPGAPALFQLLNYERIFARGERWLPLNFRPDDGGEVVFLRLMRLHADGRVSFSPSSLTLDPERDPPLELRSSKRVELRGWREGELSEALTTSGFERIERRGAFDGSPFDPASSSDLILLAR